MNPMMSNREIQLLTRHYQSSGIILEFGCGGSTQIAAKSDAYKIFSVESDQEWIKKCSETPEIKQRLDDASLKFFHAFIGETISYGRPSNKDGLAQWPTYSCGVWAMMNNHAPDVVLVDGRFRMSCMLQTLLRAPSSTRILVHDFWTRPSFKEILNYTDVLESESDLVVLLPKPHLEIRELAIRSVEYLLDSD